MIDGTRLTLIGPAREGRRTKMVYRCACGSLVTCQPWSVEHARVKSCGCLSAERTAARNAARAGMARTTKGVWFRFWSNVSFPRGGSGCWLWTGRIGDGGYGKFSLPRRSGMRQAHRVAYELCVGQIPEGLDLDHVKARGCAHRNCVNPAHLEPVTRQVNLLRGDTVTARNAARTHCPSGHPYAGANLRVTGRGSRECRTCARQRHRERNHPAAVSP